MPAILANVQPPAVSFLTFADHQRLNVSGFDISPVAAYDAGSGK